MSKTQRIEEKVTIHYEKGLHVRVAATIVQRQTVCKINITYSIPYTERDCTTYR